MRQIILALIIVAVSLPANSQNDRCKKNHDRWVLWGQYVQFNQPATDWSTVRSALCATPYNGFSVHLLSPWGNTEGFYPWVKTDQGYDLTKLNPNWTKKFREFATEIGGKGNMVLSIAFFDRYFESKWNASKMHPFRNNRFDFDWGDSADPLYDVASERNSKSWNRNSWISWKTANNRSKGTRPEFRFNKIGRAFRSYIISVISTLNEVKKEYPDLIVVYRLFNEEHARVGKNMSIESGTTLDSSIALSAIIHELWKENGPAFRMGRDLFPALDWIALDGAEPQLDSIKKANQTLRSLGWLQEIHGCSAKRVSDILQIRKIDPSMIIFSTDGLKPEDHPYFTRQSKELYRMNLPKLDLKVPNEMAEFYAGNFERTFESVLPVMMRFAVTSEDAGDER